MVATIPAAAIDGMALLYKDAVQVANASATRIKAARSDTTEAINAILDSSEDEKVTAWRARDSAGRAKIAEIQAILDKNREAIKEHAASLLPTAAEDFDLDALTKEFLGERERANLLRKALLEILRKDEKAFAELVERHGIVEIVRLGREATGSGAKGASGIRRPRISAATIDGAPVEDAKGNVTFTLLTQKLGVDGDVVRAAAFTAAGTDDLSTLPPETVVTFPVTVKDTVHTITITTKPAKADASTEEASTEEASTEEATETE